MGKDPRLSLQTLKVLQVFLESPGSALAGAEIGSQTGLASGTLYPILIRLEKFGWLSSYWKNVTAQEAKRPRRRYYKITAIGESKARQVLVQLNPNHGAPAWA
jgi:DNA-binding PadR family transcriptional regulator